MPTLLTITTLTITNKLECRLLICIYKKVQIVEPLQTWITWYIRSWGERKFFKLIMEMKRQLNFEKHPTRLKKSVSRKYWAISDSGNLSISVIVKNIKEKIHESQLGKNWIIWFIKSIQQSLTKRFAQPYLVFSYSQNSFNICDCEKYCRRTELGLVRQVLGYVIYKTFNSHLILYICKI